ncbi:MAG: 50S ribosomal protein L29 [Flavobacteriales bacterium UBA4585]|jgi:large subunit ribosomal protein L29|nr:50S ribosomal protein L29 [Schleiferiaceae bacterium]MCO4791704.1 50S ribosomal protein L29 [Flavobacteriales bacterium]CAI8166418.1 MAG: 50S ribosomal protein L29 [Flavobacteriales bacterium UBA4585]HBK20862.1 50S ribosomal protein L29 [Cryomorphaceae bacterium]MDG1055795.1 50S ribosomal protein L29 [Schleiferiaceae bacterium]|tara:strand:- start:214 stop:408 length:195 start_codon:yes stop_codon:yes gene_type:complete
MKYTEIKELATAELAERLAEEKANYMSMKLTHSLSPLENPMQIKVARKNIARLSTELSTRSTEE